MVIPVVRPRVTASARNRVPGPMGPGESFSARRMRGLYRGSFRSSATKSNTSSTGRSMTSSPAMDAMRIPPLLHPCWAPPSPANRAERPAVAGSLGRRCTLPLMAGIHERYERLLEAGVALAAELSLPAALQRIVQLAAELTDARYGALGVVGRDGVITEFITTGVSDAERAAIDHIPVGRGILGVLIDDARPLRLHDLAEDPRSVGFPANHPPMRSFLGAAVTARGQVYGNLYMTEKRDGADFDTDDERALILLATQAGVAIENAYLYEQAQDRARRLEAVRAITTSILAGTDTGELLSLVVGQARELVGADLATLALPAGTDRLVIEAADGLLADELQGTTFPASGSVTGEVLRTGRWWSWPTPRPTTGPPSRSSAPGS